MNNSFRRMLGILVMLCMSSFLMAQFTLTNQLRTSDKTGIVIGNDASLTAATGVDAEGEGWMRLNNAVGGRKGHFYLQQSFPTNLGVLVEFEYKTWRNVADNAGGADGFTIFLFDGSVTDANFKLGGSGGSLGYASFVNNQPGLSGGYIGIAFDEYGNFVRADEGRNGGTSNFIPNSVVLRGPTTADPLTTNTYITHKALGDQTGTLNDIRKRDEIDYNTTTTTRPTDAVFYRRVQVFITKMANGNYMVTVRWRKQGETLFTTLLTSEISSTQFPLPPTLKLGFAGSTGGSVNFHEIRNVLMTTPGNLRVSSLSDRNTICNDQDNKITYTIDVVNEDNVALNGIQFTNKISDAAGNALNNNQFQITSITATNFTSQNLPTSNFTNSVSASLSLAANQTGTVTITGTYKKRGLRNNTVFRSVSNVVSPASDSDLTNNTSTVNINVRKCWVITNPSLPVYGK